MANDKLIILDQSSKISSEKKKIVEKEAETISQKKKQIELITDQANEQLKESLPKIQKAEQEVRNIDRKELNTLRTLQTPPKMIEYIIATVALALEEKFVTWKDHGRKMLNDLNKFIEKLIGKIEQIKEQGSSAISDQVLSKLKSNLDNEFFSAKKLSSNIIAKPLGLWCIAIYDFAILKKQIEPLEKNLKDLQEKLELAEKEYSDIAADLKICSDEHQSLLNGFNEMNQKKEGLQRTIEVSQVKLERAERLTSLLADEGQRWNQAVVDLAGERQTLLGDVFISSAIVSYFGPLTS